MKLFKVFIGIFILLCISGFLYIGVTDVTVEQSTIEQTINNDRFFNKDTGPVNEERQRP